ncbi:hypothetical protein [Halalkalicoccus salilacus]|uniref:hypothetical protein n=1 Tax=Halalkalicoccus salilacus TaxID=3117459 RepID=UPI00300F71B1
MSKQPANSEDFYKFSNLFLKKYSHLFTIIGIFGAISVYLGTIITELSVTYLDSVLRVGQFASLSIFVLVGFLIISRYLSEYREFRGYPVTIDRKENIIPIIPIVLFIGIVTTVFFLVLATFHEGWAPLLALGLGLISIHVTKSLTGALAHRIDDSERFSLSYPSYSATLTLTISHMVFWAITVEFIYPILSPGHYLIISTFMMAIGGTLGILLLLTLYYEVGVPSGIADFM